MLRDDDEDDDDDEDGPRGEVDAELPPAAVAVPAAAVVKDEAAAADRCVLGPGDAELVRGGSGEGQAEGKGEGDDDDDDEVACGGGCNGGGEADERPPCI